MGRRGVVVLALTVFGGAAVSAATMSWAATDSPPITIPAPRPNACPPQFPAYQSNGHDYVILPDPSGKTCGTPYELPVTLPPT